MQNGARLARPIAVSDVGVGGDHDLPVFRDDLSLMIAPDDNAAVVPSFGHHAEDKAGSHGDSKLFTSSMKRERARVVPAATPLLLESAGQSPSPTSAGFEPPGAHGSLFPSSMPRGNSGDDSEPHPSNMTRKPSYQSHLSRRDGSPLHPSTQGYGQWASSHAHPVGVVLSLLSCGCPHPGGLQAWITRPPQSARPTAV